MTLGDANVAAAAALIGEPARAAMLDALMDGGARSASELARSAGVAPSTASGHLARLREGRLVACETQGRQRLFRLSSPLVADALETLARIAPPRADRSLRAANASEAIRHARTCYDHLAGFVGVGVTEALVASGALRSLDGAYELTLSGERMLTGLGVDVGAARASRRAFARKCVDWSERRPHLAGALGAELARALVAHGWFVRRPQDRGLRITELGTAGLGQLGVVAAGG